MLSWRMHSFRRGAILQINSKKLAGKHFLRLSTGGMETNLTSGQILSPPCLIYLTLLTEEVHCRMGSRHSNGTILILALATRLLSWIHVRIVFTALHLHFQ